MTLADWQWSYGGVVLGAGTAYRTQQLVGVRDLPDVRSTDLPRLLHPGDYSGLDTLAGRIITAQVAVVTGSVAALEAALTALEAATATLATGTSALAFKFPSRAAGHFLARPRKRAMPVLPSYVKGWALMSVEFYAPDPTWLAGES